MRVRTPKIPSVKPSKTTYNLINSHKGLIPVSKARGKHQKQWIRIHNHYFRIHKKKRS